MDTTDTNRFIVDSGKDAVAALDLTLIKKTEVKNNEGTVISTSTEPVTTFGAGNEVTITTYVAKNLFDVKVRYNNGTDNPEEITPESYDAETGELVFKVSHFSEFLVVCDKVVNLLWIIIVLAVLFAIEIGIVVLFIVLIEVTALLAVS